MMLSNRECESVLDDTLQILHCMTNFSTAVVIIVKGRDIFIYTSLFSATNVALATVIIIS